MSNDKELVNSDDPEIQEVLDEYDRRQAARREEERKRRLELLERHLAIKPAAEEFLLRIDNAAQFATMPSTRSLLKLHSREEGWPFYCQGCAEPGDDSLVTWPCRTVAIICGSLEIKIPENFHHYRPSLEESV